MFQPQQPPTHPPTHTDTQWAVIASLQSPGWQSKWGGNVWSLKHPQGDIMWKRHHFTKERSHAGPTEKRRRNTAERQTEATYVKGKLRIDHVCKHLRLIHTTNHNPESQLSLTLIWTKNKAQTQVAVCGSTMWATKYIQMLSAWITFAGNTFFKSWKNYISIM